MPETRYPTVVISDPHLFSRDAKVHEVTDFLLHHPCDTLILNGDILDGWKVPATKRLTMNDIEWAETFYKLEKNLKWLKLKMKISDAEIAFLELVLRLKDEGVRVIYLRGNHDDFLDRLVPFEFMGIPVVKDYLLESNGKRYYIVHGDIFDVVTTKLKVLAYLGDKGYSFIMWINHHYNKYRAWRGLEYYSFSKRVKGAFKTAVSFISTYEDQLSEVAKIQKCDGIICGHIHAPANKMIGDVHYLNSGDWVESLTGLVEHTDGRWEVVDYHDWKKGSKKSRA